MNVVAIRDVDISQLDALIERIQSAQASSLALSDDDLALILNILLNFVTLQDRLSDKDITIHKLRKLVGMASSDERLNKLLQNKANTESLNDADYAQLQKHYRNLLTRGEKEIPEVLPKAEGKRGKLAKSDAHNLLERLQKYEAAVLLFAKQADVPFTNNRSERDLRMAKVKQKVSGCFRNEIYAKAYCRISSYLQTQAARGVNPLIAIQLALAGKA